MAKLMNYRYFTALSKPSWSYRYMSNIKTIAEEPTTQPTGGENIEKIPEDVTSFVPKSETFNFNSVKFDFIPKQSSIPNEHKETLAGEPKVAQNRVIALRVSTHLGKRMYEAYPGSGTQ